GWTLESAGRTDDALKLCQWTAATFPDSATAIACLGEAYYECGRFEEALPILLEADEKEHGEARALRTLYAILRHPDHVATDAAGRAREVRGMRAPDPSAVLVPEREPGEGMVIRGVVRDVAGRPIEGARIEVFQADASGRYAPSAEMDEPDARLFAFLRTDTT